VADETITRDELAEALRTHQLKAVPGRLVNLADPDETAAGLFQAVIDARDTAAPEEPARIEVTARDLGTGDSQTVVIADDYVLICAGSCYQADVQADLAAGIHVITVKGVKRK